MAQRKKRGFMDRFLLGSEKSEGYARASLPSNRWELFWDIFKGRFWKLVLINLLIILFSVPFFLMLLMRYMAKISLGIMYPFSQGFGVGYAAAPNLIGAAEDIIFQSNLIFLLSPLAFFIAALGIAGGAYVIRNMIWTEGIFVANDFWRGIKQNFKQIAVIMLVYSTIFFFSIMSISVCEIQIAKSVDNTWIFVVSKIMTYILFIVYTFMTLHMITMSVTYELKFRHLLKNSFLFTIGLVPHNILFVFLGLIPFIALLLGGFFSFIGVILVILFGFSMFLLIWTDFCQWSYDKFVNDKVPGAQKNRGIYEKVKESDSGAIKKYREQLALAKRSALNSKPIKPITDDELKLVELPTSFNRNDIKKLNESKQAIYDDHAKYVEEHMSDPEFLPNESDEFFAKEQEEREKRIEKAKKELAKRNKK